MTPHPPGEPRRRRPPGGSLPRRRASGTGATRPPGPPFDPRARPLGMIQETWLPTEEPVILRDQERIAGARDDERHRQKAGPALAVWLMLAVVVVVVVLAVVSYRRAPP